MALSGEGASLARRFTQVKGSPGAGGTGSPVRLVTRVTWCKGPPGVPADRPRLAV